MKVSPTRPIAISWQPSTRNREHNTRAGLSDMPISSTNFSKVKYNKPIKLTNIALLPIRPKKRSGFLLNLVRKIIVSKSKKRRKYTPGL